jgi:hypothetical protein
MAATNARNSGNRHLLLATVITPAADAGLEAFQGHKL